MDTWLKTLDSGGNSPRRKLANVNLSNRHVVQLPFQYLCYSHRLVILSTLARELLLQGASSQCRFLAGQRDENKWLLNVHLCVGHLHQSPYPLPRSQGSSRKRWQKERESRRSEELCEMPSSWHDLASILLNSLQLHIMKPTAQSTLL